MILPPKNCKKRLGHRQFFHILAMATGYCCDGSMNGIRILFTTPKYWSIQMLKFDIEILYKCKGSHCSAGCPAPVCLSKKTQAANWTLLQDPQVAVISASQHRLAILVLWMPLWKGLILVILVRTIELTVVYNNNNCKNPKEQKVNKSDNDKYLNLTKALSKHCNVWVILELPKS